VCCQPTPAADPALVLRPGNRRPSFARIQRPATVDGQRISALRFGEDRAQAVLGALVVFSLNARPFKAADLRTRLAKFLGLPTLSQGQISYKLRRLHKRGLIERLPKTHRCQVTPFGLRTAVFYSRLHAHLLRPALAKITAPNTRHHPAIRKAFDHLDQIIEDHARRLAA
jgi:hypothetical protein